MKIQNTKRKKIALFGNFDASNLGNESTLQAMIYHIRCYYPDADVTCICTGPETTAAAYHIAAIPISGIFIRSWAPRNALTRMLRRACVLLLNEPYQWAKGVLTLRHTDMLIVPGTGLLTDAYGLFSWGPYSLFKWSLIAKICGCKVAFVSVGAGPLTSTMGRWFAKSMLAAADFRSYRDISTARYLSGIGVCTDYDQVYPDLAFSLPEDVVLPRMDGEGRRPVVGLGVMVDAGMRGGPGSNAATYSAYLQTLATAVPWLLDRGYDIRLLIGDLGDLDAKLRFRNLLKGRLSEANERRIVEEPITSVTDLLQQISATDVVIATRFHNILLSVLCDKPVIAISFHPKCASLMSAVGLSEYCLDIDTLQADGLIDKFRDVEANREELKAQIKERTAGFREALDEQYKLIFESL